MRNVVTHMKDRLEETETLQQQVNRNTLEQFSASPGLANEFVSAVNRPGFYAPSGFCEPAGRSVTVCE